MYVLKESNITFTNDKDKVDLDTGKPGHGPQLQESLMRLLPRKEQIGISACRGSLSRNPAGLTGTLSLSDLAEGDAICMKTDEGLIALVEIVELKTTYPTMMTIETVVAKP